MSDRTAWLLVREINSALAQASCRDRAHPTPEAHQVAILNLE
jgi:hypothetical protein